MDAPHGVVMEGYLFKRASNAFKTWNRCGSRLARLGGTGRPLGPDPSGLNPRAQTLPISSAAAGSPFRTASWFTRRSSRCVGLTPQPWQVGGRASGVFAVGPPG